MKPMPAAIAAYLQKHWQDRYAPAFLVVDAAGRLTAWGGDVERYGLRDLSRELPAVEQLALLEGMLPLSEEQPLLIPLVNCPSGQAADIHLIPVPEGCWVIFLNADEEKEQQRRLQQKSNETRLLQHRQNRLIDALQKTQQELEIKRRQAEESDRLKSRFIANMSHELRVPLASILGYARLLESRWGDDHQGREGLRTIHSSAAHLLALIDNILDQAKIEAGQMNVLPSVTHLPTLIEDMRAMFLPLALEAGLAFQVEQPASLPEHVLLDGLRLRQVIINLVNNALKFTEQGFVRLRVNWRRGRLSVAVEDSGPGIPAEARERIFQAFVQEPGAADRQRSGVGLGLAISHCLVGLMGGELQLRSEPGHGALFCFTIPAAAVEASPYRDRKPVRQTVLLAEDSEALCALTALYLKDAGFQVFMAQDGGEAVALALEHNPDLALIDLHMPVLNGLEAVKRMREAGYRRPVIALTASLGKESQQLAMRAGCNACLVKPVEMESLVEAVKAALNETSARTDEPCR